LEKTVPSDLPHALGYRRGILSDNIDTSLKGEMVYKPGTKEKVDFGTHCVSGVIVNANNALVLAANEISNKR
jgi:hypothetical protein